MSGGHTRGPWSIAGKDAFSGVGCIIGADGVFVAKPLTVKTDANARLIAAAPELLEALEQMTRAFAPHPREDTEGWREEHEAFEQACAVIAKAKGTI